LRGGLRDSLFSFRNRVAEYTNMEVDYDLDEDLTAHTGMKRSEHITYVEKHEGKRHAVKELVAGKQE